MATMKHWVDYIQKSGGEIYPSLKGTPDFQKKYSEWFDCIFIARKPSEKPVAKKTRDGMARELRKDGWIVDVEPGSEIGGSEPRIEYYLSARKPRKK